MTNEAIKQAKQAARKPGKVTTRKLTKAQLAERRKAAGLKPLTAAQKNAAVEKVGKELANNTTLARTAKSNTPKAASQRDALRTSVVKAWNASKIADAGKRRKAVATKLNCRGQVLGLLREAGIDGKSV